MGSISRLHFLWRTLEELMGSERERERERKRKRKRERTRKRER